MKKSVYFTASPLLFLALFCFLPINGHSQVVDYFKCPGFVPTPPEIESNSAATCDYNPEHPNFNNEPVFEIGVGTLFPTSSSLGNSITDNVRIVGDFTIDAPFAFEHAVVAISPNVQIIVQAGFNPFDPDGGLVIDDSDLFSCTGLWIGIMMQPGAIVNTRNNSSIADAQFAIRAVSSGSLFIRNTIFNRNWIGIELTGNTASVPNVWTFSGNVFRCNTPIKGTHLQTFAGVVLHNAILSSFSTTSLNRFQDLNFGILALGELCNLSGRNLRFDRILHDGIFMTHGIIHLLSPTTFVNCRENGINIEIARNVNITGAVILLNTALPEDPDIHRTGIVIRQFDLNASVLINNLNFTSNMNGTENRVRGIHLVGGNVGAGTTIRIGGNSIFSLKARSSQAIFLEGVFPQTSTTEIFFNQFRVSSVNDDTGGAAPAGIEASGGDKNNLSIMWNTFSGYLNGLDGNFAQSVLLRGSSGENNEVSLNTYSDAAGYCAFYNDIDGFENTVYCSNVFTSEGGAAFFFSGTSMGTEIIANTITGCTFGVFLSGANSFIGGQEQAGNQFFDLFFNGPLGMTQVGPLFHAFCEGDATNNRFTVHTTQRACGNPADPNCLFNPYYPERVEPNDPIDGLFFTDPSGIPNSGCDAQFNGPGETDVLDRRIAQGLIPVPSEEPSLGWVLERYLYKKLKGNPQLLSGHASFPVFLTNSANNSVGKFYEVCNTMEAAWQPASSVDEPSKQALTNISLVIESLAALDGQIESAGNGAGLTILLQTKQSLTDQLRSLQISYNNLSAEYKSQVATSLQAAYVLNEGIPTTQNFEINEKVVNQIRMLSFMNQGGHLTESQVFALQSLAAQDPKQGGPAVRAAMGMLPECAKPEIESAPRSMPRGLEQQNGTYKLLEDAPKVNILVSPNPASSAFRVINLEGSGGDLSLTDMTGKIVLRHSIVGPEVTVQITPSILSGVYVLKVAMDNGRTHTQKLTVQPK